MREGLLRSVEVSRVDGVEWDSSGVFVLTWQPKTGFSNWLLDGHLAVGENGRDFKTCILRPRQCKVSQSVSPIWNK
jgi:hypothetical protein